MNYIYYCVIRYFQCPICSLAMFHVHCQCFNELIILAMNMKNWQWIYGTLAGAAAIYAILEHWHWTYGTLAMNIWNTGNEHMEHWQWTYGTLAMNIWNTGNKHMEHWQWTYGTLAMNIWNIGSEREILTNKEWYVIEIWHVNITILKFTSPTKRRHLASVYIGKSHYYDGTCWISILVSHITIMAHVESLYW